VTQRVQGLPYLLVKEIAGLWTITPEEKEKIHADMSEELIGRHTPHGMPALMPAPSSPEMIRVSQVVEEVIEEVKRVYPNVKTTLPLHELLEPAEKKRTKGIPRPQNCFMLYRKDVRAEFNQRGETLSVADSSRIAAERWKELPQEEKNFWHALYEIVKMQHSVKYPDYKYQPARGKPPKKKNGIVIINGAKKNSDRRGEGSSTKNGSQTEFHQFHAGYNNSPTFAMDKKSDMFGVFKQDGRM